MDFVIDVPKHRIEDAIEKATEAFWAVIAEEFPEVKTGDVDPLYSMEWDRFVERHVKAWLRGNWPEASDGS